ncbi:M4 family metallopeptidase [Actinoplanes couchii]|uniref:Zinc metalloprotease n=1 Tax=Actinoplanes couchii TaxID=403638 RepID=A0ABQ3X7T1_9ACTN|nr:M4 family metallopeptidase [Actinoplanes couchii]MDR6320417.1 Zn-dependent metalloprotease [Actinoplanes couchii]GID54571.1 zinc metalloprotease [Actinoplanes couchii]
MKKSLALAGVTALVGSTLVATAASSSAAPKPTPPTPAQAESRADALIESRPAAIVAAKGETYDAYSTKVDADGGAHTRYTREYQGLRVAGGDFVVHTKPDGTLESTSLGLAKPLTLGTTAKVTSAKALKDAKSRFEGKLTKSDQPELFVDASTGYGILAWETVLHGWASDGQTPSRFHVITDAASGKLIGEYDEINHITGTGNSIFSGTVAVESTLSGSTYQLIDPERGNGRTCDMNNGTSTCTTFTDDDNVWGTGLNTNRQSAAVDAAFGAATTFDYFKNVHGRNGIFGDGRGVPSRVHYGNAYVNAFWDGAQMTYGDGAGNANPLVAIDVAGHEMAHGVTENIVSGGLTYSSESGGLNEATSDIFGSMVEFYANTTADPGDYDIGEEININGNGTPLRYMYDPTLDGRSHGCWSTSTASVDVHYSSGPANHFFFNLAEGTGATAYGTSPVCGAAEGVDGIGRDKAAAIWYRALDVYFASNTRYVNTSVPSNTARNYTLSAATDLYGLCSTEYKTVQAAWTAVNVAGNEDECPVANDFSVALSSNTVVLDPGTSTDVTVTTASLDGEAQTIDLAVSGLPAGVTGAFAAPSVTAGESTTLTLTAAAGAESGQAAITVRGTSPATTRRANIALTVNGLPGCSASNATDVPINDNSTSESTIVISGCDAVPSSTSKVEVHIVHTYIGDLVVSLVAPDGTAYTLQSRTGGSTDNIDTTYTVNLSSETANGAWILRVQDAAGADTGYLNSWSLNL